MQTPAKTSDFFRNELLKSIESSKTPSTVSRESLNALLSSTKTKKVNEVDKNVNFLMFVRDASETFRLTKETEVQFMREWLNVPNAQKLSDISNALPNDLHQLLAKIYSAPRTMNKIGDATRRLAVVIAESDLTFSPVQEDMIQKAIIQSLNAREENDPGYEELKEGDEGGKQALELPTPEQAVPEHEVATVAPYAFGAEAPVTEEVYKQQPKRKRGTKRSLQSAFSKTDENLDTAEHAKTQALEAIQKQTLEIVEQAKAVQAAIAASFAAAAPPQAEESATIDTASTDRQNEMTANEAEALVFHDAYVEKQDVTQAYLLKDKERGNVGAGTAATAPTADLWGMLPTQPRPDKRVPEMTLDVKQDGIVIQGDTQQPEADKFTFLPFAKLGGSIVWIPRNVEAAKFMFTSEDYDALVSNVEDGDPLTLTNEDMVDLSYMLDSITKLYMSLHVFCSLAPMLIATKSNRQQIYAEWLELRQISRALVAYQQNTAGMYENASISMRGGIRAAVGAALKPLYEKMQLSADDAAPPAPLSASFSKSQRVGEMGIIKNEDFNPQFQYEPTPFKRTKFSIPTI